MSISEKLKERIGVLVDDGRLSLLQPSSGGEMCRHMFVSKEVDDAIKWPFAENHDGFRQSEFRMALDAFVLGYELTVAEDPRNKPPYAMLARVDPVGDEIWDVRCIEPEPGIRCFGAFIGKDTFVALTWDYRENICGEIDWQREIEHCKLVWKNLFGTLARFEERNLNEYLSENFRAV